MHHSSTNWIISILKETTSSVNEKAKKKLIIDELKRIMDEEENLLRFEINLGEKEFVIWIVWNNYYSRRVIDINLFCVICEINI